MNLKTKETNLFTYFKTLLATSTIYSINHICIGSPQLMTGHLSAVQSYDRPSWGYLQPSSKVLMVKSPPLQSCDYMLGAW